MKKKSLALLLGATVICGTAGVAQLHSYAEDIKLQIAGAEDESEEETAAAETTGNAISRVSTADLVDTSAADFSYAGVADIAEAAMPSIVAITNKSVQEVQLYFQGRSFAYENESCGSGIIVGSNEEELLICTNNHVVENADELTVSFVDESSCEAQIKGTDPSNDLAVVAVKLDDIDDDTLDTIKIAQTGDSDALRVGEQVVAIGNALGYGQSVTTGIVSALDRSISVSDSEYGRGGYTTYENLIQTDAAINPGNSGGALLNMKGQLIGINSAKASRSGVEGMGYAITVAKAQPILEELMSKETRSKVDENEAAYVGITGESVSAEVTQMYNLPSGIYVSMVEPNSPADEAGLHKGDIITAFDGVAVNSMEALRDRLQYYKGGETVEMTIHSAESGAYTEKTITITLGLRTDYQ